MPDLETAGKVHSPSGSFNSTTSSLIRKSKQSDAFDNLQKDSLKEKSRLVEMIGKLNQNTDNNIEAGTTGTSSTTNEDDYDDCDEFIVNKSKNETSGASSEHHDSSVDDISSQMHSLEIKNNITPEESIKSTTSHLDQAQHLSTPEHKFAFDSSNLLQTDQTPSSSTSFGNRRSIISDYAPSIHEVHEFNKVTYVVDSSNSECQSKVEIENSDKPDISRMPSVITIKKKGSFKETDSQVISQNQFRIKSPSSQSLPIHQKNKSLGSNPSTMQTSSSRYQSSSNYSGKDFQFLNESYTTHSTLSHEQSDLKAHASISSDSKLKEVTRLTRNDSVKSTDSFNFDEGDHLTTKYSLINKGQTADINKGVDFDDIPIPSRSPNRPVSGINFNIDETAGIKGELLKYKGHTKSKSVDESESNPSNSINELTKEIDDEIETHDEHKEQDSIEQDVEQADPIQTNSSSQSLNPRPLPPPPVPQHTIIPSSSSRGISDDDGFETEEEELEVEDHPLKQNPSIPKERNSSKRKSKNSRKSKHRSTTSSVFDKNHFNHDTLVQLLQITNGTIIGQEFQNLGLKTTEKQLLERLVDSLSRLTADMIVDEERHDESVKRLNKAIKALEGF